MAVIYQHWKEKEIRASLHVFPPGVRNRTPRKHVKDVAERSPRICTRVHAQASHLVKDI